jgi:hypothetical protein
MIRVLAQAGNRASKTGRYLQWWENKSEWCAMTSVVRNHTTPLNLSVADVNGSRIEPCSRAARNLTYARVLQSIGYCEIECLANQINANMRAAVQL